MSVQGKKILLGISGGIAAYKSILLLRLLVKNGAEVQVVMTPAAKQFVSPLVLATLSKRPVICELAEGDIWANHVHLGRWADLMVVAPATCNTIAKMATGICDNLLMAVYLSATCPVMVAPAMDEDMWQHGTTKMNVERLKGLGFQILPVGKGALASGLIGEGRLLEPEEIYKYIIAHFQPADKPLQGRKALVTAGPTYEAIDPVRFIGNHSSGLMGIEIANALANAGADTTLLLGPTHLKAGDLVHTIRVTSADEMYAAAVSAFGKTDIAVMAAAVADYKPGNAAEQKIKKSDAPLHIDLVQNPDILAYCGAHKTSNQLVVGFALETNNEIENACKKLERKKADLIVLNSLNDQHAGFGTSTNKVSIFESDGNTIDLPLQSKKELAKELVLLMINRLHEKNQ
ncbi:MAG TPA: bifunctional phosphopantothenoylcysteine decarboxylase/phosphopantothenate--cysteine ligase CoaBC [Phnomibacter sp.]|nr:bifunctional phosphopantothenoylcysteine decarboxylase/phosphopantothenate--cysteine ligase CoaBC [Phnomibacter sp.]